MARKEGSRNKLNLTKESAKIKERAEELEEATIDAKMNMALLKAGAGISINTLMRAAAGDPSLEGLSATNMVSAADKLLRLYVDILGKQAFGELVDPQEGTKRDMTEEQKDSVTQEADKPSNVSPIGRYTG